MMRKTSVILLLLMFALPALAQEMGNINYYSELGDKPAATVGDAVKLFALTLDQKPKDFAAGREYLVKEGLLPDKDYMESDPLRRRTLAYMAARHLKLGDSLMFAIFKNQRYAVTACAAHDIMPGDKSEWDVLSGAELMEVMLNIAEFNGGDE